MSKLKSGYLIFPEKCKIKGCFKMTQAQHRLCPKHKHEHKRQQRLKLAAVL